MTTLLLLARQGYVFNRPELCEICEEKPATQRACFIDARICDDCAEAELVPE